MKKLLAALLAVLMVLSLAGCAKNDEPVVDNTDETVEPTTATGVYTVYNMTGAKLTELYLYEVGAEDKGTNYAADGIKNQKKVVLTYEAAADATLVLEFNYEDGTTQTFESLHIEEASITLKSVDAAAGATAIAFEDPKGTGHYAITNTTGADVTEIYMYAEDAAEKGDNLLTETLADGATYDLVFDGIYGVNYIFEFVNAEGEARNFPSLHIEDAKFDLLSVYAAAGATNIKFGY